MPTQGKILFWNTQHLSDTSDDRKEQRILATIQAYSAGVSILCEMMQSYASFQVVTCQYNTVTPHTLGYAAVDRAAANDLVINAYDVTVDPDFAAENKGGAAARNYFNRKPIEIVHGLANWPRVFALHANASKGLSCTTITALDFDTNIAGPWILVGDFNSEPERVDANLDWYSSNAEVHPPSSATHTNQRTGTTSSLDYAISSGDFTRVVVKTLRRNVSDHNPILVEWELP